MQVRWNFKLKPTKTQALQMSQWLVTLRKHRNYALREREIGYSTNNQDVDEPIVYAWGSWCDIESKVEVNILSRSVQIKLTGFGRPLSFVTCHL
ncbi:hypothetical protein NUACC21_45580 [Scytonema sp. NUACC21]